MIDLYIYIYITNQITGTNNILCMDWGMSSIVFVQIWKPDTSSTRASTSRDIRLSFQAIVSKNLSIQCCQILFHIFNVEFSIFLLWERRNHYRSLFPSLELLIFRQASYSKHLLRSMLLNQNFFYLLFIFQPISVIGISSICDTIENCSL